MSKQKSREVSGPAADPMDLLGRWRIQLDPDLLILALTHRSFAYEQGDLPHNERLEFLGDSVLSIIVTEHLFVKFPACTEAQLSRMRGAIVSQVTLAKVGRSIGLGNFILLGKGENLTGGRDRDSILCDTVEALIGATYMSHGLEPTRRVVEEHLRPFLEDAVELGRSSDYKTTLQEYTAQAGLGEPMYETTSRGPDHARVFSATVSIGGVVMGEGEGTSKKTANSSAAKAAYFRLREDATSSAE